MFGVVFFHKRSTAAQQLAARLVRGFGERVASPFDAVLTDAPRWSVSMSDEPVDQEFVRSEGFFVYVRPVRAEAGDMEDVGHEAIS